jgi:SSS family solute:Na+ symporter
MYHARMGIVLAGYMKIILPAIVVLPGLILFARYPEVMKLPWDQIRPEADKGYVTMLQSIVPIGLRGLFLAALFGAIQSTISAVLNSTSTIVTVDIYKRTLRPRATEQHLVRVGRLTSIAVMIIAAVLGGFVGRLGGSLFLYIQSLYAFFAPPFAAVFLLGILSRRINGQGATLAVILGFALGILLKVYVQFVPAHPAWLEPFQMQAAINWAFCMIVCTGVSLLTPRPDPSQVTDALTINWRKLNIFEQLGAHWYTSVYLWWGLFAALITALILVFSGLVW